MKSKATAALLAFFLGGFGVHRFYLNQTGLGFLYLLFFWTLVPAIIAIVDFVIFLTMSDEKFNAKYNTLHTFISNNQAISHPLSGADEVKKLYEMKEKGIITPEEFELKKKLLL